MDKYPHRDIDRTLPRPQSMRENQNMSQSGFWEKGRLSLFSRYTLVCALTILDCIKRSFCSLASCLTWSMMRTDRNTEKRSVGGFTPHQALILASLWWLHLSTGVFLHMLPFPSSGKLFFPFHFRTADGNKLPSEILYTHTQTHIYSPFLDFLNPAHIFSMTFIKFFIIQSAHDICFLTEP